MWFYEKLSHLLQEYSKPVFQGDDPRRKKIVASILHLCMSCGLRCLSPFMPYLTEELYQRIPGAVSEEMPSICVASYPKAIEVRIKIVKVACTFLQMLRYPCKYNCLGSPYIKIVTNACSKKCDLPLCAAENTRTDSCQTHYLSAMRSIITELARLTYHFKMSVYL